MEILAFLIGILFGGGIAIGLYEAAIVPKYQETIDQLIHLP